MLRKKIPTLRTLLNTARSKVMDKVHAVLDYMAAKQFTNETRIVGYYLDSHLQPDDTWKDYKVYFLRWAEFGFYWRDITEQSKAKETNARGALE